MTVESYLKLIDKVIEKGKYKDNWESLSNHKTPDWYYKEDVHDLVIEDVEMLGGLKIDWARDNEVLNIKVKDNISGDYPQCFKIKLG